MPGHTIGPGPLPDNGRRLPCVSPDRARHPRYPSADARPRPGSPASAPSRRTSARVSCAGQERRSSCRSSRSASWPPCWSGRGSSSRARSCGQPRGPTASSWTSSTGSTRRSTRSVARSMIAPTSRASSPHCPVAVTASSPRSTCPRAASSPNASRATCRILWDSRTIPLSEGPNVIGRDPAATVFVDSSTVSRRHAVIVVSADGATLEDLGSKNGTYLRRPAYRYPHSARGRRRARRGLGAHELPLVRGGVHEDGDGVRAHSIERIAASAAHRTRGSASSSRSVGSAGAAACPIAPSAWAQARSTCTCSPFTEQAAVRAGTAGAALGADGRDRIRGCHAYAHVQVQQPRLEGTEGRQRSRRLVAAGRAPRGRG